MTAPGDGDLERRQNLALQLETSTPAERRALSREERLRELDSPAASRRAHLVAALVFMAGAVAGLVRELGGRGAASAIAVYAAAIAVSGTAAALSHRGRTRLGFAVLAGGFIILGLAALYPRP